LTSPPFIVKSTQFKHIDDIYIVNSFVFRY